MEINEYVRTKDGKIGKYIQPELGKPNITNGISFNEGANYGKHSKDIIDLIEVGDYVNGIEIVEIYTSARDNLRHQGVMKKDINFEITSILTHEQFESNAYKMEKER